MVKGAASGNADEVASTCASPPGVTDPEGFYHLRHRRRLRRKAARQRETETITAADFTFSFDAFMESAL
jgi:hypothetical protein